MENTIHFLSELAQVTLFPSTLIAVVALWSTIRDLNRKQSEKRILEWQRVVVFTIIEENGPLSFSEIRARYYDEATDYGFSQLQDENLRSLSIRSALVHLICGHALVSLPGDSYDVARGTRWEDQLRQFQAFQNRSAVSMSTVLSEIEQNSAKYSKAEWQVRLGNSASVSEEIKQNLPSIFLALENQRFIGNDQNGKVIMLRQFPSMPTKPTISTRPHPPTNET